MANSDEEYRKIAIRLVSALPEHLRLSIKEWEVVERNFVGVLKTHTEVKK